MSWFQIGTEASIIYSRPLQPGINAERFTHTQILRRLKTEQSNFTKYLDGNMSVGMEQIKSCMYFTASSFLNKLTFLFSLFIFWEIWVIFYLS